ncbi:MAG TPA: PP2C family protein-serine/threonine phosphatase [Thermoanaerobaculia bacterium]|nr:PP2C family protein-serine/threonine phosphatase [Thermoanaerobaculia bacterium]
MDPPSSSPRPAAPPWRALGWGGAALLVGLTLALWILPEWQPVRLPEREEILRRFAEVAASVGVEPLPAAPRLRVTSEPGEIEIAYRALGGGAVDWLRREERVLLLEVSQDAAWGERSGRLTVRLSPQGEAWSVHWSPASLAELFGLPGRGTPPHEVRRAFAPPLLRSRESLGEPEQRVVAQAQVEVVPVVGSQPSQYLQVLAPPGAAAAAFRRPGSVAEAWSHVEVVPWGRLARNGAVFLALLALFVWLALRQRLDLIDGALLAALFLATSLLAAVRTDVVGLLEVTIGGAARALTLFLLWSVAESWLRASVPGFTTSLDALRRGRLGPRGGRSLLLGWGLGAWLAGARLALLAAAALLPGVRPAGTSVPLPALTPGHDPVGAGVWLAGLVVLGACLALHVLPRRWAWVAAALPAALLLAPVPLAPWWGQALIAFALAAALARGLDSLGLTATLLAAVLAYALPPLVLALLHPAWFPGTAVVLGSLVLAPLVLGFVGLRRQPQVESDPAAVPGFVRRLERQRRLSYEMDLLSRIQGGLLPRTLPHLRGYEITARSLIATEAGGDLYDFLRDDAGHLWIAAGDVSGHGYSCAIGQATVKAALLALVDADRTPARVLERADRVLRGSVSQRQFSSLCLVRLDPASGELLVANAGHPFPLIATPAGSEELELPGLPLGQGPPRTYRDRAARIPPGGVLVLYSDGLYEGADPAGRPYGFDRTRTVLARSASWNAAEILERLLFDWHRHLAGAPAADDVTIVVVKRAGLRPAQGVRKWDVGVVPGQ